ncbi:MAG: hypothetical protein V3U35_08760 [Candidatus Neomarinimicrobiota bacterium]
MQFRTYTGETERDVLAKAKAELGDKIMILELRRDTGSTAADGSAGPVVLKVGADPRGMGQHEARGGASREPGAPGVLGGTPPVTPSDQAQAAELFLLRKQLRDMKANLRVGRTCPFVEPFGHLFHLLAESGVPDHVAEELIQRTEEGLVGMNGAGEVTRGPALGALKRQISQLLLPQPKTGRGGKREVVSVVGPSGAGKTSLIVKLASHHAVYGRKRIGIISTDIFRAGANAGLKSIGNILSVPIIEVRQTEDLPRALTNLKNCDVILVDTPGRSPLSKGSLPDLQTQLAVLRPNETLLVLSANMALEELWLFAGLYQGVQPTGMVITKLDETGKPGKILGMIDDTQPPLRYVTTGQAVPQSLAVNVGRAVIERLPLEAGGA